MTSVVSGTAGRGVFERSRWLWAAAYLLALIVIALIAYQCKKLFRWVLDVRGVWKARKGVSATWVEQIEKRTLRDLWCSYQKVDQCGAAGESVDWPSTSAALRFMGLVSGTVSIMLDAGWFEKRRMEDEFQGTRNERCYSAVGKYLDDNPEANFSLEEVVYQALYTEWPGARAAPYGQPTRAGS